MRRIYALSRHPRILIIDEIDSTSLIGLGSRSKIYCVRTRARARRAASEPGDKSSNHSVSLGAQYPRSEGLCAGNRSSHRCTADVAPKALLRAYKIVATAKEVPTSQSDNRAGRWLDSGVDARRAPKTWVDRFSEVFWNNMHRRRQLANLIESPKGRIVKSYRCNRI